MTRIAFDLTPLILSAVCVAENDGNPMSAFDLAFLLDLPQSAIDLGLSQLVSKGSISKDGDLFRYDLRRKLTTSACRDRGSASPVRGDAPAYRPSAGASGQLNGRTAKGRSSYAAFLELFASSSATLSK